MAPRGPHAARTRPACGPPSGPHARAGPVRPGTPAATAAGLAGCRPARSASVFLTSPPLRVTEVRKTPAPQNTIQPGKNKKIKNKVKVKVKIPVPHRTDHGGRCKQDPARDPPYGLARKVPRIPVPLWTIDREGAGKTTPVTAPAVTVESASKTTGPLAADTYGVGRATPRHQRGQASATGPPHRLPDAFHFRGVYFP